MPCREGWHALAAQTLPKLAACQLAAGGSGLAHTAVALLSLPAPYRTGGAARQAACQLLLQAAELPGGSLSGGRSLVAGGSPAGAAGSAAVDLSPAIAAAPARGGTSRFFGRTGLAGEPLLFPPPCERGGAHAAAVGDALGIDIAVDCQLPVALRLQDVVLTLGVLQEMTGARWAENGRVRAMQQVCRCGLHLPSLASSQPSLLCPFPVQ